MRCSQIDCAGTGQDGDKQAGVASPTPRFIDNGDGTVTDNLTGLIWLKNANCFGFIDWQTALNNANALASGQCGLTDGSAAGQWRLPNIRELRSLIDYGHFNPALPAGHPFTVVPSADFWSSTGDVFSPVNAWGVFLYDGYVTLRDKTNAIPVVWPVRGGQ